ncbi:MAG: recombinase RecT [Clostridia bacterium]|nr:recombinase RecT [Clostridia bacterium]
MTSSNESQKPKFSVAIATPSYQNLIRNTLGDPERAKRFVATITSAVAVNPTLQECEAGSILAGALLGESLNLSPSPQLGQFYLVPFDVTVKGRDGKALRDENGDVVKTKKAQFVLGYKGYIQLALRSGYYKHLNVIAVKEGEYVKYNPFTEELTCNWIEDDEQRETAKTIGYAAMFEYLNGYQKILYWSKEKMLIHADKYSPAFSAAAYQKILNGEIADKDMWKYSSFWYKDFDDMAKKTMLRQIISRWGVMSTELQSAFEKDASPVEMDTDGNFVASDEKPEVIPAGTPILPEATDAVEKIDLNNV